MQCKITSSSIFVSLLFFAAWVTICSGIPGGTDLRCQCIKTVSKPINSKQISTMEFINSGPYCSKVEIIVTLKNGSKNCLNPKAKWVKPIINHILQRASKTKGEPI